MDQYYNRPNSMLYGSVWAVPWYKSTAAIIITITPTTTTKTTITKTTIITRATIIDIGLKRV